MQLLLGRTGTSLKIAMNVPSPRLEVLEVVASKGNQEIIEMRVNDSLRGVKKEQQPSCHYLE